MWNSSSQCKICYKFFEKLTSDVAENETNEDRKKLLSLCSEYLFNELCDWQTIGHKEALPFCAECSDVIEKINVLDGKLKCGKKDISDLSKQFTVKALRLRSKRQRDEVYPKIVGQTELEEDQNTIITCKICRGMYSKQSTGSLNLNMVAKVIRICKKYLFSEIFDDGCLDVAVIARLNLIPFCFDCSTVIHEICQKSDSTESISAEIVDLVNTFAYKVLDYRKNGILIEKSLEVVIKVFLSPTPDPPSQNVILAGVKEESKSDEDCMTVEVIPTGVEEESESDEDCMIVDVLPARVDRNALNSLCHNLKGGTKTSPGETFITQAFSAKTPEKISLSRDVDYLRGGRLSFAGESGTESNPTSPILEPIVFANNVSIDLKSSLLETRTVEGGEEPIFSEDVRCLRGSFIDETEVTPPPPILEPIVTASNESIDMNSSSLETGTVEGEEELIFSEEKKYVRYLRGSFIGETEASPPPPILEPIVNSSNVTIDSSSFETGTVEGEEEPRFSEETPGPSQSTNRRHSTRNEVGENYKCQNCGAVFMNKLIWLSHIDSCFGGGKIFECETCSQCFSDYLSFNEHVNSHKTGNSNTNRSLGGRGGMTEGSGNWNQLQYEKRRNLLSENNVVSHKRIRNQKLCYKCPSCSRPFSLRNHLSNHLRGNVCFGGNRQVLHGKVLSLKRVQTSKNNPIIRIVKSGKGRTYGCSLCPLTFNRSILFSKHLQTHYDIATIRCDLGRKVFKANTNKNTHVYRIHTGNYRKKTKKTVSKYRYHCSVCGMGFGRMIHLRHHLQTHYDEAPYRCTTCKRVLTNNTTLRRHMLNVHSIADF